MWGTLKHALSTIIYYKIACTSWIFHLSYLSLPLMSAKLSAKQIPHQVLSSFKIQNKTLLKKISFKGYLYNVVRSFNVPSCFLQKRSLILNVISFWRNCCCKYQWTSNKFIQFLHVPFSFSEIRLCSQIFWDSRIEWHTRNAGNSWRPRAPRTTRKRWS